LVSSSSASADSAGTVSVQSLGEERFLSKRRSPELVLQRDLYEWTAPSDPQRLWWSGTVSFEVFTGPDGIRQFVPRPPNQLGHFIGLTFQMGHNLLARDKDFDRSKWCSYLLAKLAFDLLGRSQRRLRRKLKTASSLRIEHGAARNMGRYYVLPDDLGLDADGQGRPWSIGRLLKEGREAAELAGILHPNESDQIAHGLFAAALRNPLAATPAEIKSLVSMALYDFSGLESPTNSKARSLVRQRFEEAVRCHLDDSAKSFQAWFAGGHSNLINSLANPSGAKSKRLDRATVQGALFELGRKGQSLVGECLEAFARAFAQALPSKLTGPEMKLFKTMYFRQPYLGGLPLLLLLDRDSFIKPAVLQVWAAPGDKVKVQAFHRVLRYYSEMCGFVREADRRNKQPIPIQSDSESQAATVSTTTSSYAKLHEVLQTVLERLEVHCPHCKRSANPEIDAGVMHEGHPVTMKAMCEKHGYIETVTLPWEEFVSLARDLERPS
jgi:hypothetical protein